MKVMWAYFRHRGSGKMGGYHEGNKGVSYHSHQSSLFSGRQKSKQKSSRQSDQEGYRRGMEDAIWGDSYHYYRGVKGNDSYRNGYTRGYEENSWEDD